MALMRKNNKGSYFKDLPLLQKLFWTYFLLLIFEGALRKWVAPQFSALLLLVRDPVAVFIIWEAYRTHRWPVKWSMVVGLLTAALVGLCFLQVIVGDNPWFVGIYGLRSYLLPFPVAFIMGENLDEEDLRRFGSCTLFLLLALTPVEMAQYLSSPDAFVNRGAYAGAGQLVYVGGHVRASGTFSYVVGPINFCALAAAFIFYGLVNGKFVSRWLLWAASFALILSVPVIGARTLVFEIGGIFICVGIGAVLGVSQFGRTLRLILPVLIVSFLASQLPIFSDSTNSLADRFTESASVEGGSTQKAVVDRTLGVIVNLVQNTDFGGNWLGMGMGRGAAAMVTLLTGTQEFLAGEDEFSREMSEFGPVAGTAFALFRVLLAAYLVGHAMARARDQAPLALLLVPMTLSCVLMGVVEQPTEQGFLVIGVGFSIAATKLGRAVIERGAVPLPQWSAVRKPHVRTIAR